MKKIGIIFFFLLSVFLSSAQKPTRTGQIVTKKEQVKLSELTVLDSTFLNRIDDLSVTVNHPLNLYDGKPNVIYLSIDSSSCNNITSYSIYVNTEKQFMYVPGIWGFFKTGEKLFIVNGDNIPELFRRTGKFKLFNYITTIGLKTSNGSILPMIADNVSVDDTRIALVFTYSNGKVEFEKIFESY